MALVEGETEIWEVIEAPDSGIPVQLLAPIRDSDGLIQLFEIDWGDGTVTSEYSHCLINNKHAWTHYYPEEGGFYQVQGKTVDNDGAVSRWRTWLLVFPDGRVRNQVPVYYSGEGMDCEPLDLSLLCDENDTSSPCPTSTGDSSSDLELRLFVPKIEGSTDECAPGELGTDYQTPGYGYQVFDDNGNLLAPDSNSTPVTCNAIDELNNAASYLYTIPTHSQSLVIRYLAEDAENLSCMPYAASFTVGDSVPTVIINGDRTQTYYTGETFRLTTTFEDDEDTPMLTRWEIIGSEHPTMYGNDFHSIRPRQALTM